MNDNVEKDTSIVKIPIEDIIKIVEDVEEGNSKIEALRNLKKPWALIMKDNYGKYFTMGFETRSDCADEVSECYMNEGFSIVHVLKRGIPRKNITIEVKARFR
jgi:hypothetical protein